MGRNIAVIGAGMAGLAAARELARGGYDITVYEKSGGVGGRVATRRIADCIVDHGAQNIKPQGSALEQVMLRELPADDLIAIAPPVRLMGENGDLLPPDPDRNADAKYSYRRGMTTLAKLLAADLPPERAQIRFHTRIARLDETDSDIILRDETGEEAGRAEIVIVSAPAPQAADLLGDSAPFGRNTWESLDRVKALRQVDYHRNLTVLLGYAPPAPPPPAYALLAEDRSSNLLWLAFEQTKAPERAPNGEAVLIAQMGPKFSDFYFDAVDEIVATGAISALQPYFGPTYDAPLWTQVKRWKYAQPFGMVRFEEVNFPGMQSRVIVCGDGLRPENGRVHQAYASGLEAAELAGKM